MHKKRFGQHFLSDPAILRRIVTFSQIGRGDDVLEIGPGQGALTRELAATSHHVIAIEIDRDLIGPLRAEMPSNVEIIEGDALDIDFPAEPFHVVANLPYNVATPLLKRFIEHRRCIVDVTIMVQAEVADRIAAKPGTSPYGPLSVLVQYYAEATRGFTLPPGAFRPKPKVDSAVIRLKWKPNVEDNLPFTDFVHRAFGSRRKKLANNLGSMLRERGREEIIEALDLAGIPREARPEAVSVDQFLDVYNRLMRRRTLTT